VNICPRHAVYVSADCRAWIEEEVEKTRRGNTSPAPAGPRTAGYGVAAGDFIAADELRTWTSFKQGGQVYGVP
jgi:hypothetical protein